MKLSNFCRGEHHDGCHPRGLMLSTSGKKFRCHCACHHDARSAREERDASRTIDRQHSTRVSPARREVQARPR